RHFYIVTGGSYDMDEVRKAEEFSGGVLVSNPKPETDPWNWQGAALYTYRDTGKVHADFSSRTRFPTLFDPYSTRFDTRLANPDLEPERATNYEIGWSDNIGKS